MDEPTRDLVVKSLESEPIKNLLGPVTQEIGAFVGDLGNLLRFYGNLSLERIFTKWARQRHNQPLAVEDFVRVLPLLLPASYQTEDELQERWAALLESVVSCPGDVLPSFGQTLSQLTTEEALFLGRIYSSVESKQIGPTQTLNTLSGVFDPELKVVTYTDHSRLESTIKHAHLLIEDFERLGLLTRLDRGQLTEDWDGVKLTTSYSLSDYGRRFIQAVTPKD